MCITIVPLLLLVLLAFILLLIVLFPVLLLLQLLQSVKTIQLSSFFNHFCKPFSQTITKVFVMVGRNQVQHFLCILEVPGVQCHVVVIALICQKLHFPFQIKEKPFIESLCVEQMRHPFMVNSRVYGCSKAWKIDKFD